MGLLVLILLVIILLGTVPAYPYSRRWGYRPSGLVGVLVLVVVLMLVLGYLPWTFGPGPVVAGP